VVERVPTGIGNLGYRQRSPNWLVVGVVTGAILLLVVLYQFLAPGGSGGGNDPGLLARAPVATATTAPTTASTAPPSTRAKPTGVELVLRYTAASWTVVEADGKIVFRGTPTADEKRTFNAKRAIELTLGNAGGVQLTVNGQSVGTAGSSSRILHRTFKPGDPAPDQ
jgi:Domain of unknown function (DUF4115)